MSRSIFWSPRSKLDYIKLLDYLLEEWGHESVKKFNTLRVKSLDQISENPELYQATIKRRNIRRCVISKQTSLYYRVKKREIELITLFDTRQHPKKKKLK